jgi:hypothetical protein
MLLQEIYRPKFLLSTVDSLIETVNIQDLSTDFKISGQCRVTSYIRNTWTEMTQ